MRPRASATGWPDLCRRANWPPTKPVRRRPGLRVAASGGSAEPTPTSRPARIEALLWLAGEPLTERQVADAASLSGVGEAREELRRLEKRLQDRGSALEVVQVAGGYCLATRPQYAAWLRDADEPPVVTPAALETLAVVAGRQPVVRAEVEAVRGVGCGELLRQLLDADLLRIVGRSDELGKPLVYGTSRRFLRVFGLRGLADLPLAEQSAAVANPTTDNAPPDEGANEAA